jgi:D-beta-D-heptose 7-phosphate kinase / D-beta-D-heptose 1-phosphate adenosyltransferase
MFKNFDFIKPNKIYTESLLKQKINTTSKSRLFKSIKILLKKFKLKNLIVTLGADGVAFINSTKKIYEASKKIQFYNLSGAGDVFGAAFFTAYLKNKDIKEALKFANYSTSLAIQKKGTASINEYELDNNEPIYYFKKDKLKLRKILENKKNEKIAFTNGCFDIFHPGHLSLIKFAKKKSDYLIIGLNSDKSVKKLKGKNRPIISEQERAMLLANLKDVNLVIIFDEISPLSLIKFINPNFLIKGADYKNQKIIGSEFVKKIGGKTYIAPLKGSFSSSKILNKNE